MARRALQQAGGGHHGAGIERVGGKVDVLQCEPSGFPGGVRRRDLEGFFGLVFDCIFF